MHLPHVADRHADPQPPGRPGRGLHPFAQDMKWHQLKLADAVALAVNEGPQTAAFDR
jgi:hypothetical protein